MKYLPLSVLGLFALTFTAAAVAANHQFTKSGCGAVFTRSPSLRLIANGSDADGFIAKVEFFQGATKLARSLTTQRFTEFLFTWTNAPAGNYSLTAVATDNGGSATTSAPVICTVHDSPRTRPTLCPRNQCGDTWITAATRGQPGEP